MKESQLDDYINEFDTLQSSLADLYPDLVKDEYQISVM